MKTMQKKFLLGMLAIALVFGMAVLGCSDEDKDETDPALNGTWAMYYYGSYDSQGKGSNIQYYNEVKLDNGKFEMYERGIKGTYTTKDGKITGKPTHILYSGSKWYTKDDLKRLVKEMGYSGAILVQAEAEIEEMFKPQTAAYSIKGNTLTISGGEFAGTYIKK
jgi:hypothetical protein